MRIIRRRWASRFNRELVAEHQIHLPGQKQLLCVDPPGLIRFARVAHQRVCRGARRRAAAQGLVRAGGLGGSGGSWAALSRGLGLETPDGVWGWSAVDLAAMTDANHQDQQLGALPFVNHAEVAHTQAPQTLEFPLEGRTGCRGVAEQIDGCDESRSIGL